VSSTAASNVSGVVSGASSYSWALTIIVGWVAGE